MRKPWVVIGSTVALVALLVGCSSGVSSLPTSPLPEKSVESVRPVNAPEEVTWVSPGKVQVGNFHLGATAEWPVLVHNGKDEPRTFRIAYKLPASAGKGYLRAPTDVVQDWVVVADSSFILAPKETKEVLVSLIMPGEVSEREARFLEFTKSGQDYLVSGTRAYWEKYLDSYLKQDPNRPEVMRAKADAAWGDALKKYLEDTLEMNLLVYLNEKGSLSYRLLLSDRADDADLIETFVAAKFLAEGNLLTDKWEFWVDVMDTEQGGSGGEETGGRVQVSMAVRWLVTMRG